MKAADPHERFERIEHQLEFLAVSAQSHDSQLAETAKLLAECAKLNAENSSRITENSKQIAENSIKIGQLADFILRIGRLAEAQDSRMDKAFARIAEAQARTDERLNALINTVERYLSNGRN
jgi:uncharacterized protein (UPF0335 family)